MSLKGKRGLNIGRRDGREETYPLSRAAEEGGSARFGQAVALREVEGQRDAHELLDVGRQGGAAAGDTPQPAAERRPDFGKDDAVQQWGGLQMHSDDSSP